MHVLITHLTRMQPGYICVAGIQPDTGKHIRPVLNGRLGRTLLRRDGGVFEIGAIVDLGATTHVGEAPETEDYRFSVENLRYRERVRPAEFWKYLDRTSSNKLKDIFGGELEQRDSSCTVDINSGRASLGHLVPAEISNIEVDPWDKIRIHLSDSKFNPNLSVTDLRLYKEDQKTPRRRIVERAAKQIAKGEVVLAVGLTRAWAKRGDASPRHWLQINNIHFQDDPLGDLFEF
jgi:putative nucleic acid modification protein with dual OB domain